MTTDASRNPVTFHFGPDRCLTAEAPAHAADAVRRAWRTVAAEHDARPETVTAIDVRWQPSIMDKRYVELTFGDVEVTYAFARPAAGGWDAALAEAARRLDEAERTTAADGAERRGELLPVVHSMSLPAGRKLWETVPAFAVIDEALFATLVRTTTTPDGLLAGESLGWDEIRDQDDFLARAGDAALRLMSGLSMEASTVDGETRLVRIRHDGQLAGSAVVLANLHGIVVDAYGWEEQIVAIPSPNEMVIVPAGSPAEAELRTLVRDAPPRSATLRPTLLRLTAAGCEILLEGGPEPEPDVNDPAYSMVMFHRGPDPADAVNALMTARDDDAVRRAWQRVVAEHGVRADEVTGVAAQWQPSARDAAFIAETFGDVEQYYIFGRPDEDGWEKAFATARRFNEEANRKLEEERLAEAARGIVESTKDATVLPVLRSASLPGSDFVKKTRPYWPVVGDAIYATLARVALTPRGTVGMGHVLHSQVTDDEDFARQAAEAVAAVMEGLVVEGLADEDGDAVFRLSRRDGFLAAGAICLSDFHDRIAEITGWSELVVAITCPDHLYVAPAGSAAAEKLRVNVAEAEVEDRELRPTLLRCTADGLELLLESDR